MSDDLPPYVPLLPYPATGTPDPLKDNVDLNKFYQVSNGCNTPKCCSYSLPRHSCINGKTVADFLLAFTGRKPRVGPGIHRARVSDDPRRWFLLLWACTAKVGFVTHIAVHVGHSCCQFSGKLLAYTLSCSLYIILFIYLFLTVAYIVVLLGIFSHIFA